MQVAKIGNFTEYKFLKIEMSAECKSTFGKFALYKLQKIRMQVET